MVRSRRFLVLLLLLAQLWYHPVCARRILIWKLLARTNRTLLKSDWTGNLLTTTIDALIRAKTQQQQQQQQQQEQYESDVNNAAGSRRTTLGGISTNNHRLASHRGGAVLATSHHQITTRTPNRNLADKVQALIFRNPLLSSPWTMGVIVGVVTVGCVIQQWRSSYPGVTLEDWELMCRDQLPDFWKTEVLPLLESENNEHCNGRLAKTMIRKTRPLMKQRIQLAEQVSSILGSHLKTRQPLTLQEKATLATYYAEITVEKLHSVTEGLRQKLERANNNNNNSNNNSMEQDQKASTTTRYLGERSKIIQGLVQRIRTYMDGDAIMLDETTLREYFKESLREAIVVVPSNEENDDSPLNSSSSDVEQDLATDEQIADVGPSDPSPENDSIPEYQDAEANPAITLPSEVVDHEQ